MNLEATWKSLQTTDDELDKLLAQEKPARTVVAHNSLAQVKRALLYNIIMSVLTGLSYVVILIMFPVWQVQLSILIIIVVSLWAISSTYRVYRQIQPYISHTNSVLDELIRHYNGVQQWMRQQQRVALFLYPISLLGGFMLGGVLGSGESVEEIMSRPIVWVVLGIVLVVFTPLSYLLSRWFFRLFFGKYMKRMKENIDCLSSE